MGLPFTIIMAGFDYYDGKEFQLPKYVFAAAFYGLFMGFLFRNNSKSKIESDNLDTANINN